jgi:hypothetical protein
MEPRFGHDFSRVQVHTDRKAAESARAVNALAYTISNHIVFNVDQYQPATRDGRRLLAHELTHTRQQAEGLKRSSMNNDGNESQAEVEAVETARSLEESEGPTPAGIMMDYKPIEVIAHQELASSPSQTEPSQQASPTGGSGQEQTEAGANPTGSQAGCQPTPLTRQAFLQQSGATQRDLGLTRLAGQVGTPAVQISPASNGVLLPTSAVQAPITSAYTRGSFIEGDAHFVSQSSSGCPSKRYPLEWNIFGSGEQAIRQGEQEHCDDFQLAFDLSLVRFANEVNTVAQTGRRFANQQAAEQFFARRVGVAPSQWFDHYSCLSNKTRLRDRRDWHTPRGTSRGMREPVYPCDKVRFFVDSGHFPDIGRHPSSTVITTEGCPT